MANALFPSEIAAPASNVFFLSRQGIGDQVIDPEDETGFVDENALEHTVLSEFRIIGGQINFPHIIGRETQRSSHRLPNDAGRTLPRREVLIGASFVKRDARDPLRTFILRALGAYRPPHIPSAQPAHITNKKNHKL